MRILIVHSQYLSGAVSGENRVVEDEKALLEQGGHDVIAWMPSPEAAGKADLIRLAARSIWSKHATKKLDTLIEDFRPDVVHAHNLFPSLSPAALRVGGRKSIPTLVTLHNYRLMCLPGTFVRDGKICEDCLGKPPWRGVVHRCHRDSAGASAVLAGSIGFHRAASSFERPIRYLAVSEFLRSKHIEHGFPPEQVIVKPNFAWPALRRSGPGAYFLYLGRLAPEKGVSHLMRSWDRVDAPLRIVGDGPEIEDLKRSAPSNVEFTGPIPGPDVPGVLADARALLVPSTWYEGAPRGIIEAFAAGVPVVASAIGGLSELIAEGSNGFLAKPGHADSWAATAQLLLEDELSMSLGAGAYRTWEERFTPERGLENLEAVYRLAIEEAAGLRDQAAG